VESDVSSYQIKTATRTYLFLRVTPGHSFSGSECQHPNALDSLGGRKCGWVLITDLGFYLMWVQDSDR